jgi:hypothetical protein
MAQFWVVKNDFQLQQFLEFVEGELEAGRERSYEIYKETRTSAQNRALYAVFTRLAVALNDAGFEIKHPFAGFDIPWSKSSVKELLFNPIMKEVTGKGSTTELERRELSECMGALLRGVDQKLGVYVAGLEGELDGQR